MKIINNIINLEKNITNLNKTQCLINYLLE